MSVVACSSLPPTGYSYLIIICVAVYVVGVWDCGWTVDRGPWHVAVVGTTSVIND